MKRDRLKDVRIRHFKGILWKIKDLQKGQALYYQARRDLLYLLRVEHSVTLKELSSLTGWSKEKIRIEIERRQYADEKSNG